MKKDLIFVVVLFAFITNINSQEIHFPTSDDNPIWQLKYESMFVDTPRYSTYGMIGDTTINSFKYSRVYRISDTIPVNENIKYYYGAIREDLDKKRVYIIENGQTQEQLLYDFSAELNDTILYDSVVFYYDYCMAGPLFIESLFVYNIDSISIRNLKLKRMRVSGSADDGVWIQGVGNLYMPFLPGVVFTDCGTYEELSCFKRNDSIYYPKRYCFHVITSIDDFESKNNFEIYPNPANNYINLSSLAGKSNNTIYVKLFDYTGRLILNKQVDNTHILTFPDFPSGLYFLNIYDNTRNLLMIKKIIIQN